MAIPLSKENMLRGMEEMNAFGPRLTGSQGHKAFVEYLKQEVAAIGYDVHSDTHTFKRWEPKNCSLVLHTKEGDVPVSIASAFPYSGETKASGRKGRLSKLGIGKDIVVVRVKDFSKTPSAVAFSERRAEPADLHLPKYYKGPVATAFVKSTVDIILARLAFAKAAVFIWEGMSPAMVEGQYLNFILPHLGIPTLWVNAEEGEKVLAARKEGCKATLTLDANIEKKASADSFYVEVPGKEASEVVIIHSHTDGCNAVEENGPVAMLEMLRYYKTHQPERSLLFVFGTGHFRIPAFRHFNGGSVADQSTSVWLHEHRDLWDGKRGHKYAVASLGLEHFGCTEWKDVDGIYTQTNDIDIEVTYTGNQTMDDILYQALAEERTRTRTVSLRPHNFLHFGEGQSLFNVGIPDISLVTAPDYLTAETEGAEMDKFDLDLMTEQVAAFIRMEQLINEKSRDELGRAEGYSFGLGKVHK